MFLEQCFFYEELNDYPFPIDYLDMMEYTIKSFDEGLINENLQIVNPGCIDMSMIDLDAIRWKKGELSTKQLYDNFKKFYMRAN